MASVIRHEPPPLPPGMTMVDYLEFKELEKYLKNRGFKIELTMQMKKLIEAADALEAAINEMPSDAPRAAAKMAEAYCQYTAVIDLIIEILQPIVIDEKTADKMANYYRDQIMELLKKEGVE